MKNAYHKPLIVIILLTILICLVSTANADQYVSPYASPVFTSTSITLGDNMEADFMAAMRYNCSKIYVSSCELQTKNSQGQWVFESNIVAPSDIAQNTSNFDTYFDYSSYCIKGVTYRIKAVFKAVYNSSTYSVTGYSNGATYR